MKVINEKLLNEVCTINSENKFLVGRISKIYEDKFAVNILNSDTNQKIILNEEVEILIETLDNEIYFYVALVESQHIISSNQIIFFKPISEIHENNKRKNTRLKVSTFIKSPFVYYRNFPPIGSNLIKTKLIDISIGGLQFLSDKYLSKKDLIEVKLHQPFVKVSEFIICRVVSIKSEGKEYYISVNFLNLSSKNKEQIESFINNAHENYQRLLK